MTPRRKNDREKELQDSRPVPCDGCFRRKVRCGGGTPCNRCIDSSLPCTRNIVRKKRGPKKGNGSVISRLRAESGPSSPVDPAPTSAGSVGQPPTSIAVASLLNEPSATAYAPIQVPLSAERFVTLNEFAHQVLQTDGLFGPQTSYFASPTSVGTSLGSPLPSTAGSSGIDVLPKVESPMDYGTPFVDSNLNSPGFWTNMSFDEQPLLLRCVDLFFTNIYPIFPLIEEQNFRAKLQSPGDLPVIDRVLVLAMCSLVVVHVSGWPDLSHESRVVLGKRLVQQSVSLRLTCDFTENTSISGILASLFLQTTYFELRRRKSSWFYLREAITLAQAARLHEAAGYESMTEIERICAMRTYCLLFITERGASILNTLPVCIKGVPQLPADILPGEGLDILAGLQSLYGLFALLDESFVDVWNETAQPMPQTVGQVNIALLQDRLKDVQLDTFGLSDIQGADILITQQWLRLVFWQTAMRQGLVSSAAPDPAFTYDFPREIGRALATILGRLPQDAIQVHGLGIFEKQFEVAYSLLDNLTLSQSQSPEDYDCLKFLFQCLSQSPSSRDTYVRALESKLDGQQPKRRNPSGVEFIVNWESKEGRRLSVV